MGNGFLKHICYVQEELLKIKYHLLVALMELSKKHSLTSQVDHDEDTPCKGAQSIEKSHSD